MTIIFLKFSTGMWLTIIGTVFLLAGQIKVYLENEEASAKQEELNNSNQKLLKQNKKLNKDLKKINLDQTNILEDQEFFRGIDVSYLRKSFDNHSAYIFRQKFDGKVSKKSISQDSEIYEDYSARLLFKGENAYLEYEIINVRPNPGKSVVFQNVKTEESISHTSKDYDKMQLISSAVRLSLDGDFRSLGNNNSKSEKEICLYYKLIDINKKKKEITFAVGRAICNK